LRIFAPVAVDSQKKRAKFERFFEQKFNFHNFTVKIWQTIGGWSRKTGNARKRAKNALQGAFVVCGIGTPKHNKNATRGKNERDRGKQKTQLL
jgi:hypothetical protein